MSSAACVLEERIKLGQLGSSATVHHEQRVDLLAELSRVGTGCPHMPFVEERMSAASAAASCL
jgi:hypothetical protein